MPSRSKGWSTAKRTGHEYEHELFELGTEDAQSFVKQLGSFTNKPGNRIAEVKVPYGAIETLLGDKSEGKPDARLTFENEDRFNLSIKKPGSQANGQAHLSTLDRFKKAWREISGRPLDIEVVKYLELFIGKDGVSDIQELAPGVVPTSRLHARTQQSLDVHQVRLSAATIASYKPATAKAFMQWARSEAVLIADVFLFRGYAANKQDYAQGIWFGREQKLVMREALLAGVKRHPQVHIGASGGTVRFPWGFLQFHAPRGRRQLQAHWESGKIISLISENS